MFRNKYIHFQTALNDNNLNLNLNLNFQNKKFFFQNKKIKSFFKKTILFQKKHFNKNSVFEIFIIIVQNTKKT